MSIRNLRSLISEMSLLESESLGAALIIGDSQSQGRIGANVESFLKDRGFATARKSFPGKPGRVVLENLKALNVSDFSLVVAIFGGNDPSVESATSALSEIYNLCNSNGTKLIAIGPPPATRIENLETAKRVFGDSVNSVDWHLKRDEGRYPGRRINIAIAIDRFGDNRPGIATYGIAARKTWPETYPAQPDGVHCVNGAQQIAEEAMRECIQKLEI